MEVKAARSGRLNLAVLMMGLLVACSPPAPPTPEAEASDDRPPGKWKPVRPAPSEPELSEEQAAAVAALENLGYLDGVAPGPDQAGVTKYLPQHTAPGLNLLLSSHAPVAYLMTLEGEVAHEWSSSFEDSFPDYPRETGSMNRFFWRRVRLLPEGDLLAIHEGMGIVRMDLDSRVRWSLPNRAHHDLDLDAEGNIYVLTRTIEILERYGDNPAMLDFVDVIHPSGEERDRYSIEEAYLEADVPTSNLDMNAAGDVFHTNAVEILDGRLAHLNPAFAAGNLLLSFRRQNEIAVLDVGQRKITWIARGGWRGQHDPTVLDTGRILIYDNWGGSGESDASRLLEIDPIDGTILWQYEGTAQTPFFSAQQGAAQRLPNGNTLVSESDNGRAFEIDREGRIVWEYVNPRRAGSNEEFIAVIPDVVRIGYAEVEDWLDLPAGLSVSRDVSAF